MWFTDPRFAFEKFRGSPAVLSTPNEVGGEAMAIGRWLRGIVPESP